MPSKSVFRSLFFSAACLGLTGLLALGFAAPASAQSSGLSEEVKKVTSEDGLYAVFQTSMGDIVTQLYYDKVPVTVGNFVQLAEGTKEWTDPNTGEKVTQPLYDDTIFHRVIKDFMIQGGDPQGTGMGGPGYRFMDEFDPSLRHDKAGVLSMANAGPGTNGSQFFITHKPTPWLDDKHSVFGQVVLGQDVVDAMAGVPMTGSKPNEDIRLKHVEIVRTGSAAEAFDAGQAFAKAEEIQREKEEAAKKAAEAFLSELEADKAKASTTDSGLMFVVLEEGSGASPNQGDTIVAHYTGYLTDGRKFDSSVDRGQPFKTPIGVGRVIKGWDEAFLDMKVGEKRRLIIPPDLGYGARGAGGVIPPNATLVFDVELLDVEAQ